MHKVKTGVNSSNLIYNAPYGRCIPCQD